MTDVDYCLDTLYKSKSNFIKAFWFLKREHFEALAAIYSFAHRIDHCVDDITEHAVAIQQLKFWTKELDCIFDLNQKPSHPITRCLYDIHQKKPWPPNPFYQLIEGMTHDIESATISSKTTLDNYCYKVAATIGELIFHIIQPERKNIKEIAYHCGLYMQKINILRDIGEDDRKERCYIPDDFLVIQQIDKPLISLNTSQIDTIVNYLNEQIEQHGQEIQRLTSKDQLPTFVNLILLTYSQLHLEILRQKNKLMTHKIKLGGMSKLFIFGKLLCHKILKQPLLAAGSAA